MDRFDVLASVAVVALVGVLIYALKTAPTTSTTATAYQPQETDLAAAMGAAYNQGPAVYVANQPFLFWSPVGNVIPSTGSSLATGSDVDQALSILTAAIGGS